MINFITQTSVILALVWTSVLVRVTSAKGAVLAIPEGFGTAFLGNMSVTLNRIL